MERCALLILGVVGLVMICTPILIDFILLQSFRSGVKNELREFFEGPKVEVMIDK